MIQKLIFWDLKIKSNKIEWRGLRIALGSTEEPGGSSPVSHFSWEYLEKSFRDKYKVQWNQWNQYFLTGHRPPNPYVRFYKKIRFQTSLKNFNVILKVLSVVCDPVCFIFTTSINKIRSYNIFFVQFLKCVINSTNIPNKKTFFWTQTCELTWTEVWCRISLVPSDISTKLPRGTGVFCLSNPGVRASELIQPYRKQKINRFGLTVFLLS